MLRAAECTAEGWRNTVLHTVVLIAARAGAKLADSFAEPGARARPRSGTVLVHECGTAGEVVTGEASTMPVNQGTWNISQAKWVRKPKPASDSSGKRRNLGAISPVALRAHLSPAPESDHPAVLAAHASHLPERASGGCSRARHTLSVGWRRAAARKMGGPCPGASPACAGPGPARGLSARSRARSARYGTAVRALAVDWLIVARPCLLQCGRHPSDPARQREFRECRLPGERPHA